MGIQFSAFVSITSNQNKNLEMFLLFLFLKLVAANPVDENFLQIQKTDDAGFLITVPDCFPFCGVEDKMEELKNIFKPCFPFCGVQTEQMDNLIKVEELPSCFPNCGNPENPSTDLPTTDYPSTDPPIIVPTSLFEPCFPFCEVPFPDFDALFPSCFPFCGVTQFQGQN